jgi:hypothetical protein
MRDFSDVVTARVLCRLVFVRGFWSDSLVEGTRRIFIGIWSCVGLLNFGRCECASRHQSCTSEFRLLTLSATCASLPIPILNIIVTERAPSLHATITLRQDMGAFLSRLPNRLRTTLCLEAPDDSLLDTTAKQPSNTESFRFLDLPPELRSMVYEHVTHDLMIRVPDLGLPVCATVTGAVEKCFYPSIMLVCHQLRSEYTAIIMRPMTLHILVACHGVNGTRGRLGDAGAYCSNIPLWVLAQITQLEFDIRMGREGPHCGM